MVTLLSAQTTDSTILQSDCTDNNLRLVEGPSANEGKIKICINGFCGTVCSYRFDDADARVVCRQLGFQALGMVSSCLEFGRLSSFISNNPYLVVQHRNSYNCTTAPLFVAKIIKTVFSTALVHIIYCGFHLCLPLSKLGNFVYAHACIKTCQQSVI